MLFNHSKPRPPKPYLNRWEPGDILQVLTFGQWEDLQILSSQSDVPFALSLCAKGTHRIISPARTVIKAGAGEGNGL